MLKDSLPNPANHFNKHCTFSHSNTINAQSTTAVTIVTYAKFFPLRCIISGRYRSCNVHRTEILKKINRHVLVLHAFINRCWIVQNVLKFHDSYIVSVTVYVSTISKRIFIVRVRPVWVSLYMGFNRISMVFWECISGVQSHYYYIYIYIIVLPL